MKSVGYLGTDQRQVFVTLSVLNLVDADGVDLSERAVFQTPANDMLNSVENLVLMMCEKPPRSLSMTAAAPNGLGKAYRLWSVCV